MEIEQDYKKIAAKKKIKSVKREEIKQANTAVQKGKKCYAIIISTV